MASLTRRSPLVILPFLLWGTAMVVMKGILPELSPLFIASVRLLPAGVLIVVWGLLTGRPLPRGWLAWLWIGAFAAIDGTLFQGLLAEGLGRVSAGLGSLLIDSQPLVVAVLAAIFFQERIGAIGVMGLVVGSLGIVLIGLPETWIEALWAQDWPTLANLGSFNTGEWLMLGASLAMAGGTILIRPVTRYADPVMATGWHMILGSLPLAFLSLTQEHQNLSSISPWGWLGLAYTAIMGSAIAYGLFFYFASTGNLTTLSTLTFSTPIFAIVFGRVFLGEHLSLVQWIGVALTLVSIYLVTSTQAIAEGT